VGRECGQTRPPLPQPAGGHQQGRPQALVSSVCMTVCLTRRWFVARGSLRAPVCLHGASVQLQQSGDRVATWVTAAQWCHRSSVHAIPCNPVNPPIPCPWSTPPPLQAPRPPHPSAPDGPAVHL
jgi:hypothetical protein